MPQSHDDAYNRDQDQKPDKPRMAQEPGEGSARSAKTQTDPASGEHRRSDPAPNQAEADQTDGAGKRSR